MLNLPEDINSTSKLPQYLVAIGASAGGVEALEELFSAMPVETDMVFVVIQHLSPDHKSMMNELLARKTEIPIIVVKNEMKVYADTIYLLPPQKEMIVLNGRFYLTEREAKNGLSLPINIFFKSAAQYYGNNCIGIILSGSGTDGTEGIKDIHDVGGFTIVQNTKSCKFDSMPFSAVNTGKVDLALDTHEIPNYLIKYHSNKNNIEELKLFAKNGVDELFQIIQLIDDNYHLDFSQYRKTTIASRIVRRMNMNNFESYDKYYVYLKQHPEEIDTLYHDLLIGVTEFFRDKEAFACLKSNLLTAINNFNLIQDEEFRVWVPGCATGEEAYSIAIILNEIKLEFGKDFNYKIFATDIHDVSLKKAAFGIYEYSKIKTIDERYIERYFENDNNHFYKLNSEIKSHIIFGKHDITRDTPFTKMHLISCRNLLIYFNTNTKNRVLGLISFALKNKGCLFLGLSENPGRYSSDFTELNTTHKLYQKTRESYKSQILNMPSTSTSLPRGLRSSYDSQSLEHRKKRAIDALLQAYVPASVLITSSGDVVYTFGDVSKYLEIPTGDNITNIKLMVNDSVRAVIIQILNQYKKDKKTIKTRFVKGFKDAESVDLRLKPLSDYEKDSDYLLLSISENSQEVKNKDSYNDVIEIPTDNSAAFSMDERFLELEDELYCTRENLKITVEELESSNEEMLSVNEELMASNQELQSTNEELQSVNEELITVNHEYQEKEKEREEIRKLIESSEIGIILLDKGLCLRRYSDTASSIFNFISADLGRSIESIATVYAKNIIEDIKKIYKFGGVVERNIVHEDNKVYLMKIHRLEEKTKFNKIHITGVVLIFNNITNLIEYQELLKNSQLRFESMVNALSEGYFEWNKDKEFLYLSDKTRSLLGYKSEECLDFSQLISDNSEIDVNVMLNGHDSRPKEKFLRLKKADGSDFWTLCKYRIVFDINNEKSIEGHLIDMSMFKEMEVELNDKVKKLKDSNNALEEFTHIMSHDLKAPIRHSLFAVDMIIEEISDYDKDQIENSLKEIIGYLKNLQSIIDDVIRFSKYRTQNINIGKYDLNKIINKLIPIIKSNFKDKNITVNCHELLKVPCDRYMMEHLLLNLLHNSCKYNDANVVLDIECVKENANYILKIKDNGIGFDMKFQDEIFKPFKRLVPKSQYEGSGMGLAICKGIVSKHKGSLSVQSQPGEGSVFTIVLKDID